MSDCSGAHCARLQSDVKIAVDKPTVVESSGSLSERKHFGVRHRVTRSEHLVTTAPNYSAITDDYSPNRDLSGSLRARSFTQCFLHPQFIIYPVAHTMHMVHGAVANPGDMETNRPAYVITT